VSVVDKPVISGSPGRHHRTISVTLPVIRGWWPDPEKHPLTTGPAVTYVADDTHP
jgi:hypothetical protein